MTSLFNPSGIGALSPFLTEQGKAPEATPGVISFGPFRLTPSERLLERAGQPVHLGARALDILTLLAARAGEVVSKREIFEHVWPDIAVDEVSLRVRMAELRKILTGGDPGTRYITTIQSQGYCFVARISREWHSTNTEISSDTGPRKHNLPTILSRVIGRDDAIRGICERTLAHRLVSIIGSGGIGKSTVAICSINLMQEAFEDGIYFADLGQVVDARLVPATVANMFGLSVESDDPLTKIFNFVHGKHILLVLDCCEHVVDAVADLVEALITATTGLHILATSREAMNLAGENIHRLSPLAVPPEGLTISAEEAMRFPAVQLLVEKIAANRDDFELTDADAPVAASICRRLDGVALAIELAAGHVDVFGLAGTAAGLNTQFRSIVNLRRFSVPRHQTIFTALDWSYNLLSEIEQSVARGLSTFIGAFTLEAARAVAQYDGCSEFEAEAALAALCAKSLVSVDISAATTYYRLLDATRAYLSDKLFEHNEARQVTRRHAEYYCTKLKAAHAEAPTFHDQDWFDTLNKQIGNIRAALEWTFSDESDAEAAIALATSSASIFVDMSLLSECLHWTRRALALPEPSRLDIAQEFELRIAFAVSLLYTVGVSADALQALDRALELALQSNNRLYKMRLFSAFFKYHLMRGDFRMALAIAQDSEVLALEIGDPVILTMVHATLGLTCHLTARHEDARKYCELAMQPLNPLVNHQQSVRFDFDYRNAAACALARNFWLAGKPEQAQRQAAQSLAWALTLQNPINICISLVWAALVNLLMGHLDEAQSLAERLGRYAQDFSLTPYRGLTLSFKGIILARRGATEQGLALLQSGLQHLKSVNYKIHFSDLLCHLAEALSDAGRGEDALAALAQCFESIETNGDNFILPEAFRVKGVIAARLPTSDNSPETCFLESITIAQTQNARSWELRSTISLAKHLATQNRHTEAAVSLRQIYQKFDEGFATADHTAAYQLLAELDCQPAYIQIESGAQ